MVANFVQTIDGVVSIPDQKRSNALIAGGSDADRFVMGLLRAAADAIVIGTATMNASPNGTWRPERAFPDAAAGFAQLRRARGRPASPALAVLTGGRSVDPAHPAFETGALVLTTHDAAGALRTRLPAASEVVAVGDGLRVDPVAALGELRARGYTNVLSEAGPTGFTALHDAGVVDELFVTSAPLLAGRADRPRPGLVAGRELLPGAGPVELLSVRRAGSHLFLRYRLRP